MAMMKSGLQQQKPQIINTPEQQALDVAMAEIAKMEKDSEAFNNP
jgi:hypothetical protein